MTKIIKEFYNQLGWEGRKRDFAFLNALYGDPNKEYTIVFFKLIKTFEKQYSSLNSSKEYVYVANGNLERALNDLRFYDYRRSVMYTKQNKTLRLQLMNDRVPSDFIRQPDKILLKARFYLATKEELAHIPFKCSPITDKRNGIWSTYLDDSIEMTPQLKAYLTKKFKSIQTTEARNILLKYQPLIQSEVKEYVPHKVNDKALTLAIKHNLNELEFNFLNYFYETEKKLRNGIGQMFYDVDSPGIGYSHDRKWVKNKMKRLIELGLVKFEIRHDCRDARYTSWYFYDAEKNFKNLKHDF